MNTPPPSAHSRLLVQFGDKGLHLRVASRIIRVCKDYDVQCSISRLDGGTATGKSIVGMLRLGLKAHQEGVLALQGNPGAVQRCEQVLRSLFRKVEPMQA